MLHTHGHRLTNCACQQSFYLTSITQPADYDDVTILIKSAELEINMKMFERDVLKLSLATESTGFDIIESRNQRLI